MISPNQPLTAPALSDLFGFSLDELEANRAGSLSPRQRQLVRYRAVGHLVRGVGMIVLGVILTLAVTPDRSLTYQLLLLKVGQGLMACLAVFWLIAAWQIAFPTIETVTGGLQRSTNGLRPTVIIGTERLRISARRWRKLPSMLPGRYRAYIGPEHTLFSLEPGDDSL